MDNPFSVFGDVSLAKGDLFNNHKLSDGEIMKKIIVGSILCISLAAGIAAAHQNGYEQRGYPGHMAYDSHGMMSDYGDCPGVSGFGDAWSSETHQRFLEDTLALRKELNGKRFDYMEARRNQNSTPVQLAIIEKEIIDLRAELQEKIDQVR